MPPKKTRRRVPSLPMRPLRTVAAVVEHPRVAGLVGRALRAALPREATTGQPAFPSAPPLPARAASAETLVPEASLLAELSRTPGGTPSLLDYSAAYRDKAASPTEVAELFLRAATDSDRQGMHFFIRVEADDVRAQALASEQRHQEGRPLSVFDGVPVAVKDEIDLAGYPTTLGAQMPGRPVARKDCAAVARLRSLGAVLVGKTNMHELGAGPTGWNARWGTCRNPWDHRHFTGGSSSGSAAVVAARMVPLAVGCDGGGSIRIPASFCGVVGLKATFGRVAKRGETPPIAHSVTHIGPLGHSVRDVAAGYAAMAGHDDEDSDTHEQPAVQLRGYDDTDLRGVTLGLVEEWWRDADADVARACERALGALQSSGARVVDVHIDGLASVRDILFATIGAELSHNDWFHDLASRKELAPDTRIGLALARHMPRETYFVAQRARASIAEQVWRKLDDVHAFISPTTLMTAPRIWDGPHGVSDLDQMVQIMRTTALANITGQPAISFPVGFDRHGLPIGFQATGRPWDELLLLRIASAGERMRDWRDPPRAWSTLPSL